MGNPGDFETPAQATLGRILYLTGMKKLLLLPIAAFALLACQNDQDDSLNLAALEGTWLLTEVLFDPKVLINSPESPEILNAGLLSSRRN